MEGEPAPTSTVRRGRPPKLKPEVITIKESLDIKDTEEMDVDEEVLKLTSALPPALEYMLEGPDVPVVESSRPSSSLEPLLGKEKQQGRPKKIDRVEKLKTQARRGRPRKNTTQNDSPPELDIKLEEMEQDDDKISGDLIPEVEVEVVEEINLDSEKELEIKDEDAKAEVDEDETSTDLLFEEGLGRNGKRIRAAAAAAMELVAKKQTEGDRADRRPRKPYVKTPVPKGRSRRTIFFKRSQKPTMGCKVVAGPYICKSLFHGGIYYQEGDIVFIVGDDDLEYFCQIRGLMRDGNFEASASLAWLTPKPGFDGPRFPFDPTEYMIRDDIDQVLRVLDCVTFITHCPLDYYYCREITYFQPMKGVVYQRMGYPLVIKEKIPLKTTTELATEKECPAEEA